MSQLRRMTMIAAALVAAACSSGGEDDTAQAAPAEPRLPPAPVAAQPAPIEVAPARSPEAPPPALADVIARARKAAPPTETDSNRRRRPTVTLYEVSHDYREPIETGDVWRKFQLSLHNGFARCYRDVLRKDKSAAGRATVKMRVTAGGRVDRITVEDAFDERIGPCLKRYAGGWKFGVLADDVGAVLSLTVGFDQ